MAAPTSNGVSARSMASSEDRILQAIFDPEHPLLVDVEPCEDGEGVKEVELTEEEKRAKDLELQAVKVADGDNSRLGEALELLNRAVAEAPGYASAYNNRAQVYRLQHEVNLALSDLDSAITLSGGRGQVAEQALTQRGLVRSLQEDEEGALEDFKAAARLGSSFAQQQVVAMNPIAALCSSVVKQIFEQQQQHQDSGETG